MQLGWHVFLVSTDTNDIITGTLILPGSSPPGTNQSHQEENQEAIDPSPERLSRGGGAESVG